MRADRSTLVGSRRLQETCGGTVALKALTGMATLSHGQTAKALLLLSSANATWSLALNAMGQDQSGEHVSLFLEDWELARVGLSCCVALNLLCQEMHGLAAGLLLPRFPFSQQEKEAFLSPWTG